MADIEGIKRLRTETGHSLGKCKEALEEAGGDLEKARGILRERGAVAAEKKSERTLGSGVVESYIHTTRRIGAMVELLCETDFVARNEEFIELARNVAMHCAAFQPRFLSRDDVPEEVMRQVTSELQEEVDAGKPADIQEKILSGKVDTKMREVVLLEQMYLKDDTRAVKSLVDEAVQKFGERIEIGRFVIFSV